MCSASSSPVASLLSDTGDCARMCHASRFASELRTCISTAIPKRKKVAQEKAKNDHLCHPLEHCHGKLRLMIKMPLFSNWSIGTNKKNAEGSNKPKVHDEGSGAHLLVPGSS